MQQAIERILELQTHYDWRNTPEMQERGELIRDEMPVWIRKRLESIASMFPQDAKDLSVDASDGVGRKSRIPWVRIFSRSLAPSAKSGWYLTYLFAGDGSAAYLTVGQATSEVPDRLVDLGNEWARNRLGDPASPEIRNQIDLAETAGVGATFQDGVVEALRYPKDAVPDEDRLESDLELMAGRLATLYAKILDGDVPAGDDPTFWATQLHEALEAVDDLSAPAPGKFSEVDNLVAEAAGVPLERVYTAGVSKNGNLSVRFDQSARAQSAKLGVAVLYSEAEVSSILGTARTRVEGNKPKNLVLVHRDEDTGEWRLSTIVAPTGSPVTVKLAHRFPDVEVVSVSTPGVPQTDELDGPVVLDGRIERLLQASYKSARFVVLVGPPGTGKSRLAATLLRDAAEEPEAFGLSTPPGADWVTPDENWSVRDLVGGESVVSGDIVFSPGHLLTAIAGNRQLVIDELNRADMDRIFGAALTWLATVAGEEVVVGRRAPDANAGPVVLRWGSKPASRVFVDGDEEDPSSKLVYEAGTDFRILGTYNGVDAHQVFRLGQALGRRFQQVPIAPVDEERFSELLEARLEVLDEEDRGVVSRSVQDLYRVHLSLFERLVPPASFLDIPSHVAASEGDIAERITEGYLATLGGWLAKQDPEDVDALGRELVDQGVLPDSEWLWVQKLIPLLT